MPHSRKLTIIAAGLASAALAPRVATAYELSLGEYLDPNQSLWSQAGYFMLVMQPDCNLVLYESEPYDPDYRPTTEGAIWATNTAREGYDCRATMQPDGNLVIQENYGSGRVVWASGTERRGADRLMVQNDGNVVIYTAGWQALWATGTVESPGPEPDNRPSGMVLSFTDRLLRDEYINSNLEAGPTDRIVSSNGAYVLIMQNDCNLVLYSGREALWSSRTATGRYGCLAVMQSDGNFVVYERLGPAVWATGTDGSGAAEVIVQDDGNLVIYTDAGGAVWDTGTNR